MAADFVFGVQSVTETLNADKPIDKLFIQRELSKASPKVIYVLEEAKKRAIPIAKVPLEKLNRITRKNHQGMIAFISVVRYQPLSNIIPQLYEEGKVPLILILDRVTDVRNFGAITRTAECAGVHAIVIPSKGAAQVNSDAMKTSSGALNYLPVCREPNLDKTIVFLQESGLQIVACTEKTEDSIYLPDYTAPTAIVMGSEEDGISQALIRKADHLAKIPLQGNIGSLNVSVATSIIVYEAVRQRKI